MVGKDSRSRWVFALSEDLCCEEGLRRVDKSSLSSKYQSMSRKGYLQVVSPVCLSRMALSANRFG